MHCMAKAKKTSSATAPPGVSSLAQRLLQVVACDSRIDSVQRAQGGDDDLAGGDRSQQSDADLPVEAERTNHRLDRMWPTLATTLSCICGGCPWCMGKLVSAHSSSDTSMITVPAR